MESKVAFNLKVCAADAADDMKSFAVEAASRALMNKLKGDVKRFNEVAMMVSRALAEEYGGAWHVIVGKSFGSFVTHETATLLYFFLGQIGFLAFKHG